MTVRLAVYHQCFRNQKATAFALQAFFRHNPGVPYFLWSDAGDDFSGIASHYADVIFRRSEVNAGKNQYTLDNLVEVFSRIKEVAELTRADLILNMEDDVLTRSKITIQPGTVCSSLHVPGNRLPVACTRLLREKYQLEPLQDWYGMAGGCFLNGSLFRDQWPLIQEFVFRDYPLLFREGGLAVSHEDILFHLIHAIAGLHPEHRSYVRQFTRRSRFSPLRIYDIVRYGHAPLLHNFKKYY